MTVQNPHHQINGYQLNAEELFNTTFEEVVETLKMGDPVYVILEPGDATRYELLIVPLHPSRMKFPMYNWSHAQMWQITRYNNGRPSKSTLYYEGNEFELADICNGSEHTAELFHWCIPLLWKEIYANN